MLLSDYLKIGYDLEELGVFDPVLDTDSNFFINLQRLKKTAVPEFVNSYEKIHDYFRKIIKLLDRAVKKDITDIFYKQALAMFDFSEVNGICLGYAKGNRGAGFGTELAEKVIDTAYEIVKAGIVDPEFFELLPLFQDNVGPDRLSDMIATLILDDIKNYTKRINNELQITSDKFEQFLFDGEYLINPYKHDVVLLVPVDILHELPVAETWEDIDCVVTRNSIIRAEMNSEVAAAWYKYSSAERKNYIKRTIFNDPDVCKRVIDGYQGEELEPLDFHSDIQYLLEKIWQSVERLNFLWQVHENAADSYSVAIDILSFFKQWVENNKGWEVIVEADSRSREKIVQRVIHGMALSYIEANKLDMTCEADEGRGPADFKISMGVDKTIIEVKLSSNSQYLHGYEVQIEEYGKAEQTDKLIYVLVDLGHPGKIKKIQKLHDARLNNGEKTPILVIVDSTEKLSASIT